MHIIEIVAPGSELNESDTDFERKSKWLISLLVSHFFEANTALNLYETDRESACQRFDDSLIDIFKIQSRLIDLHKPTTTTEWKNVYFETTLDFERECWKIGEIPIALKNKPQIYAKSYVLALHNIGSHLEMMSSQEEYNDRNFTTCAQEFRDLIPDLKEVRNSIHHVEDRAVRKGRKGAINPSKFQNGFVTISERSLSLNSIFGNKFGCTMQDGRFGQVEISATLLEQVKAIIESALFKFKWKGRRNLLTI